MNTRGHGGSVWILCSRCSSIMINVMHFLNLILTFTKKKHFKVFKTNHIFICDSSFPFDEFFEVKSLLKQLLLDAKTDEDPWRKSLDTP